MSEKKCMGYCDEGIAKHPDPKNPPLDYGFVLCDMCFVGHCEEAIEECEEEIEHIKEMRAKAGL